MTDGTTFAGIVVPSTSPLFLAGVAAHVAAAIVSVVAGAVAMLSRKGRGRHSRFGSLYVYSLGVVVVTAAGLALVRWSEDYQLFALALLAFAAAAWGRGRIRASPPAYRGHIAGMGLSYVVMLTAFYVDNGKQLPVWKALPTIAYWLAPGVIGLPIVVWAILRHPLVRSRTAN